MNIYSHKIDIKHYSSTWIFIFFITSAPFPSLTDSPAVTEEDEDHSEDNDNPPRVSDKVSNHIPSENRTRLVLLCSKIAFCHPYYYLHSSNGPYTPSHR